MASASRVRNWGVHVLYRLVLGTHAYRMLANLLLRQKVHMLQDVSAKFPIPDTMHSIDQIQEQIGPKFTLI